MTDLATKPGADDEPSADKAAPESDGAEIGEPAESSSEQTLAEDESGSASEEPDAAADEPDLESEEPDAAEDASAQPSAPAESADEGIADEGAADLTEAPRPASDDATAEAEAITETGETGETTPLDAVTVAVAAPGASLQPAPPGPTVYAWAPPEPAPRKRRTPLWVGIAAGVALVSLIAASLVLIAPGTSVAGVGVGGLTPGGAAGALQQRLDDTTIVLAGDGGGAVITGADLGATVDAETLAKHAFDSHPMWNPTRWFSASIDAPVQVDAAVATAALRKAAPDLFADPVDATLAYDATTATYVTTPAVPGAGIDVDAVRTALQNAYDAGKARVTFTPVKSAVEPATTTAAAKTAAASLNTILGTAGFYVDKERTVPVDRATVASWLTVTHQPDGTFTTAADVAAIQKVVDTLPAAINRNAVNATVITDSAGKVLRTMAAGVSGRALGDTAKVAAAYAAQLASGKGAYALPVTVKDFTTTALARRIEVNISQQHAYLYENGKVVYSYPISSGLPGHDTNLGHFHIYAKVKSQNMGNPDLTVAPNYYTKNVPNISYFDGDEALHGAYWHHNFGHRMSHGCVNMPLDAAALVYDWAPIGTEVWVHS